MKKIENLRYQIDVVTTFVDNPKEEYILWVDAWDRLISTTKGISKQITDHYEIVKYCKIFGYPIEGITNKIL